MAGTYVRTPEIRAKQRAAMTGKFAEGKHPLKGVKKSAEHIKKMSDGMKGKPSVFKGRKHTEESKQTMSFSKTGKTLNKNERKERKEEHTRKWIATHPEAIKQYDEKYRDKRTKVTSERRRKVRRQAIEKLGDRCSSPTCKWVNDDGSRGCTDFRILQFDHVFGGGTKHRKLVGFEKLCKDVLSDSTGKYQLLCSNCNWIKAFENKEFGVKT